MYTGECIRDIQFDEQDHVTCIAHPHTYLNKVLVGTRSGVLQLWNIKSKKVFIIIL